MTKLTRCLAVSDRRYDFITPSGNARLTTAARGLLGREIVRARYAAHDFWYLKEEWDRAQRPFHQTDDCVVLDLDDRTVLEIGAVAPAYSWGIDVHLGSPLPPLEGRIVADVSATELWQRSLRRPISDVRAAWKPNDGGEPPSVWSLALVLDDEAGVVIALGETYEGPLRVHPDNLVVFFDRDQAVAHAIPDGTCAWGQSVLRR